VRAGERCVTTKRHFNGRRKPPQKKLAVPALEEERRLRQVHLGGDRLHPLSISLFVQQADTRRVSSKRLIREGIHLPDHGAVHDAVSC
jgi:hypothetical protein